MTPALGSIYGPTSHTVTQSPAQFMHKSFPEMRLPAHNMQPGSCAKSKAKKPYLGTPGLVPAHAAPVTGQGPGATQSTDTQDATSALQLVAVCIRANYTQGLTGQALWKNRGITSQEKAQILQVLGC